MPAIPKPPACRQRRNRATGARTLVAAAPARRPLPEGRDWDPMTRAWWDTIWDSPMATEWVQADVPALLMIARLVDDFWERPSARLSGEIRLGCREFGLSPLSRRTLQWEVRRVESAAPPSPPSRPRDPRLRAV